MAIPHQWPEQPIYAWAGSVERAGAAPQLADSGSGRAGAVHDDGDSRATAVRWARTILGSVPAGPAEVRSAWSDTIGSLHGEPRSAAWGQPYAFTAEQRPRAFEAQPYAATAGRVGCRGRPDPFLSWPKWMLRFVHKIMRGAPPGGVGEDDQRERLAVSAADEECGMSAGAARKWWVMCLCQPISFGTCCPA
jgi:hypothetical protein